MSKTSNRFELQQNDLDTFVHRKIPTFQLWVRA